MPRSVVYMNHVTLPRKTWRPGRLTDDSLRETPLLALEGSAGDECALMEAERHARRA